jgi:putative ABC transport system permease protein
VRPYDGREIARMVELRGVGPDYPFYGELRLAGGQPYAHTLVLGQGVLVRPELLAQLEMEVGERLIIGERAFTIRGVIEREPGGQTGLFSLGPRVLLDRQDLLDTGLLTFGSRARYRVLLRMPEGETDGLWRALRDEFRDEVVSVRSFRSTGDRVGSELRRAEDYLSLIGFVIAVLGGIGVWSVTRVFMREKTRTLAILKCVGGTTSQVLATYLLQVLVLGLAGSLFGAALAWVAVQWIPPSVSEALGGGPFGVTADAVFQGLAVGLLVSVLFALVPLLDARKVRPWLLLHAGGDRNARRIAEGAVPSGRIRVPQVDRFDAAALALVGVGLVSVATWQAGSISVGASVCAGLAGMAVVLHAIGVALVRATAPLTRHRSFPLRHAVRGIRRPNNQTRVILLAVGLASFFILAARGVQHNLLAELAVQLRSDMPDLFLIDIQPDQVAGVRAILAKSESARGESRFLPVMRARVTGVGGRELRLDGADEVRRQGELGREFVVTYRDRLAENERLVAGQFWPADLDDQASQVSVELGLSERHQIRVGDQLRFEIAGRDVAARVASIREVDWTESTSGGFMFVFRPGVVDRGPHTYIAPVLASPDPAARARLQYDLVAAFPNVSAIDVREILDRAASVLEAVALAVSIVGAVALAGGLLILVGAVAMTKFQRVYEAAVLRTLGATTRTLGVMLALEYGVLGVLAGVAGGVGALALVWAVARWVLDIPWRPATGLTLLGALAAGALVSVVGVVASLDVLRHKPLGTLRAE